MVSPTKGPQPKPKQNNMKKVKLTHTLTKEKKEFIIIDEKNTFLATAVDNESHGHFILSKECYMCHDTQTPRKDVFVDNMDNPNIIVYEKEILGMDKNPIKYNLAI